jgi:hypothetical protein
LELSTFLNLHEETNDYGHHCCNTKISIDLMVKRSYMCECGTNYTLITMLVGVRIFLGIIMNIVGIAAPLRSSP